MFKTVAIAVIFACAAHASFGQETYSLEQLLKLGLENNRSIWAARDQVEFARAGLVTASAYPNPEVEALSGPARARFSDGRSGTAQSFTLTQKIDLPPIRANRQDLAGATLEVAQAAFRAFQADLIARIKLRYYELLRREAEVIAAAEELELMREIRRRVSLRTESGEAPRYELIKADTEFMQAQKHAQATVMRVEQARANLRRETAGELPAHFTVIGELSTPPPRPSLEKLRSEITSKNPEIALARAEAERGAYQLKLERSKRLPELALRAGYDQDPDLNTSRFGIVVTIPLWDQRTGPIAEAAAHAQRMAHERIYREFSILQALEATWQQYEIAATQVTALENGIVRQAEAALNVAAAAHRFGERGILDYLDAQRVYRAARSELIAARYELHSADIEIERLLASR